MSQRIKVLESPTALAILTLLSGAPLACDSDAEDEGRAPAGDGSELDPLGPSESEPDDGVELEPVADASVRRFVGGEVVADVELDGGTRVTFLKIDHPSGLSGVGVLEESPMNTATLGDFDELADASVADVFWAISEPGQPIPEAIAREGELNDLGPQGWALDAIASGEILKPRGTCDSDAVFSNYVTSKGYDHEYLRLNQHPNTSGYFIQEDFHPGNGNVYDLYTYSPNGSYNGSAWYNVDRYYSRVGACRISGHPTIYGEEYGPKISFDYRDANNNGWYSAFWVDVDWGDSDVTFSWHWYTGADWDWRTQVEFAAWDDIFDIGHALNN